MKGVGKTLREMRRRESMCVCARGRGGGWGWVGGGGGERKATPVHAEDADERPEAA